MLMLKLSISFLILSNACGNFVNNSFDGIFAHNEFGNKITELLEKNIDISVKCKKHLFGYVEGLRSGKLWALKMFDSMSKIPDGILDGNFVDLGSFDECFDAEGSFDNSELIHGKYCLGTIAIKDGSLQSAQKFPNLIKRGVLEMMFGMHEPRPRSSTFEMKLQLATCMPDTCSANEIQKIYAKVGPGMTFNEDSCQSKATQPNLTVGSIAALSFFGGVLWIMLASTVYDVILFYLEKRPAHVIFIAFSVFTNGKQLMKISNNKNQISCLHGIRVISTMWVIIGHKYSIQMTFPMKNLLYIPEWIHNQANMVIMGAPVSVDTFFLMAGLVLSYIYMSSSAKGVKFNIILYYVHRYLRLTPLLAAIILIHVTLLEHLGSGPLWLTYIRTYLIENCEKNWWKALIYIQNYGKLDLCIPQSWYLSVDTQLFLLSPLFLIPLGKWPQLTLYATGCLSILSIVTCFLTAWFFELNGMIMGNSLEGQMENYMKYYYMATQTRAAPWLIGIILGYYIFKIKQKNTIVINKIIVGCLWIYALMILCTCVFAGHGMGMGEYNRLANSFYIALVRPAWSIALGWIIFACVTGYGGPVNSFLSLPIFQVISKFTYSLYLVHYTLIFIATAQMRTTPIISNSRQMYLFWPDFVFALVCATILTLAFESPIIVIEKCIFGCGSEKNRKERSTVNKSIETA